MTAAPDIAIDVHGLTKSFGGRAVVAPAVVDTLPGLTVTVLAPDPGGLKRLLEHWPEVTRGDSFYSQRTRGPWRPALEPLSLRTVRHD